MQTAKILNIDASEKSQKEEINWLIEQIRIERARSIKERFTIVIPETIVKIEKPIPTEAFDFWPV
jgi:hypothetical protein